MRTAFVPMHPDRQKRHNGVSTIHHAVATPRDVVR